LFKQPVVTTVSYYLGNKYFNEKDGIFTCSRRVLTTYFISLQHRLWKEGCKREYFITKFDHISPQIMLTELQSLFAPGRAPMSPFTSSRIRKIDICNQKRFTKENATNQKYIRVYWKIFCKDRIPWIQFHILYLNLSLTHVQAMQHLLVRFFKHKFISRSWSFLREFYRL
jgi:hypothetical protein